MEVEIARQTRTNCKSRLTKFKTFLDKIINSEIYDSGDIEEVKLRLKKIEETWSEYDHAQRMLELLAPSQTRENERIEFEDNFFKYTTLATKILNTQNLVTNQTETNELEIQKKRIAQLESQLLEQRQSELSNLRDLASSRSSVQSEHARIHISLPKLDLPTFSGGYDDWMGFRDSFVAIIHDEISIPKIQKLRYLKSYLRGSAARIIESLPTSEANYDIAWKLLDERYNNKRIIIQTHMQALFEIPTLTSKDSSTGLRDLLDTLLRHIRALEVLGEPTSKWDTPLICMIGAKLDKDTRREWERSVRGSEMPVFEQLIKFLRERCNVLEAIGTGVSDYSRENSKIVNKVHSSLEKKQSGKSFVNVQAINCPNCDRDHYLRECSDFLKMNVDDRSNLVRKKGLCFNCLSRGHLIANCRSRNCYHCNRRHHTLLHNEIADSNPSDVKKLNSDLPKNLHVLDSSKVILSTALVDFVDEGGKLHTCRVLLDSGSQPNLITRELANLLKLKKNKLNSSVEVINNKETLSSEWVTAEFKSKTSHYTRKLNFLIFPQITSNLPASPINKNILQVPDHLKLSDPGFHKPASVEALIGGELFYELLCNGKVPLALPRTFLQNTRLGWIVAGKANCAGFNQRLSCNLIRDPLTEQLENFWRLEEIKNKKHLSMEEEKCESHFRENIQRDVDGRYMVALPFNEKLQDLGSTFEIARRRFFSLERRLKRDQDLREQYHQFMRNYEELGHMKLVSNPDKEGYYIPHHPVFKDSSLTTKLRVVFDASAKSSTGVSLNQVLMVGPIIQDGIFELVLRFRRHAYVMSADIEKMFRQFLVRPEDRRFQRILWRYDENEPLRTYELNTITYGTSSAPFQATRCLQQLAEDERKHFPEAAEVISEDIYVDDLLTGEETLEEARELRNQVIETAKKAGLRFCKWIANDARLTDDLVDCSNLVRQQICQEQNSKTLGVCWNSTEDSLCFEVNIKKKEGTISKRLMLSQIAQLFDPMGLLAPVIIFAKMQLQELWKVTLHWDDPVSAELSATWQDYLDQLSLINNWNIPRSVKLSGAKSLQLHGFADASEKAYGACLYLRSENNVECKSFLLCAKSRVAPIKTVSLPRLELCAAHLLSKLFVMARDSLRIKFDKTYFWSDSTITLNWINTSPHTLKTFVANRVSEIQETTMPEDWKHVPTKDNPADFISRGQLPREFVTNELWKEGPVWLKNAESAWPSCPIKILEIPEKKGVKTMVNAIIEGWDLWQRYSSWPKLIRIVAYCLRFANLIRKRTTSRGLLEVSERMNAKLCILKSVQQEMFKEEMKSLHTGKEIPRSSRVLMLNPFLEDNLMRVGGRIGRSSLDYDQKYPILLPKSHSLTDLIVRDCHNRLMHAGTNATLYELRQCYWIVDGRVTVRRIIHSCLKCCRTKPKEFNYLMGELPEVRVSVSRPFETVGIDYCGYFYVKEKKFQNRKRVKVYAAIFVCMATKALHIELVGDLTTEALIGALRRFFSRRGKARSLYSDNATNFIGAEGELRSLHELLNSKLHNERIGNLLSEEQIEWHFIPPRSPHFGGVWEAAVKSLKHHLRRTVGETLFTFEELATYMCEIESVLNSRPLTPMSSDPNDLQVLTPGHFLIGQPLTALPSADFSQIPVNRLSSWQHMQKMKLDLWKRWKNEYLTELNVRSKWCTSQNASIKLGSLVLLKEDNLPPLRWALGRVLKVHPGDDNVIRVVTVKTEKGEYKRAVKKLAPLPIDL